RGDPHADVEIARLTSGSPRLASPGHADPGAVLHAAGHLHLHGPRTPYHSAAVARGARGLDRSARSRARGTRLLHLEEALVDRDLPASTAGRARDRLGTGSGAGALARGAHRRTVERDGDGHPRHRAREPCAEAPGAHLAHAIVRDALLIITQGVVGGGDLLEPLLGLGVAGVRIGVVLLRELPIGLLDVGRARVLGHAEDLVVVL